MKVYISLAEAEKLISDKILSVPTSRTSISRAQGTYSVAIIIEEHQPISSDGAICICFSCIERFEIPEEDRKLFMVNYELPAGIITTVKRKYKDSDVIETSLLEDPNTLKYKVYNRVRRGLVSLLLSEDASLLQTYDIESDTSKILTELLIALSPLETFPETNIGQLSNTKFDRWVWLGKFINDNASPLLEEAARKDLSSFLHSLKPTEFSSNSTFNVGFHPSINPFIDLILGYYFACQNIEINHSNALNVGVLIWSNFFKGFFDEAMNYLYPVSLLRYTFYEIELTSFQIATSVLDGEDVSSLGTIPTVKLDSEELLKGYQALESGCEHSLVKIVDQKDVLAQFQTGLLHGDNRGKVGEILHGSQGRTGLNNYIIVAGNTFTYFQENMNFKPTFYGETAQIDLPAHIPIKTRPLSKLVDRKRDILVVRGADGNLPNLVDLYRKINEDVSHPRFKKVLLVNFLRDHQTNLIHAIDQSSSIENELQNLFPGAETDVFNFRSKASNHREIIKWFRTHLANVKINQIEIVDDEFGPDIANCLIAAFPEYAVRTETPPSKVWAAPSYRRKIEKQ